MKSATITSVLDTEYMEYGMYTIEHRAIPSAVDGFKPTQRKAAYTASRIWRKGDEKPMRVYQLAGKMAAECAYHHGDCLDGDTKIRLSDGNTITIGEWFRVYPDSRLDVVSFDERTQEFVDAVGHSPRIGQIADVEYEIELENGEIIRCTGNHPVLTDRGWVKAQDLLDTDKMVSP